MAKELNLTRQECDARGDQIQVRTYRVELDLSAAATDTATFGSRTTVTFVSRADSTWIDLVADSVESVRVNGEQVSTANYDGARILLHDLVIGENEVVIEATCRYSRTGEGLHRFHDPQDDSTYLYTHCEPTHARRIFACFEQPDLKGEYTLVVTAPGEWIVRANQPEVESIRRGDLTTRTFAPTPPLSSYLVALIAGPYAMVQDEVVLARPDGTSQHIALTATCRRQMLDHLESAEIFELTRAGLEFFDRAFGFPYPWGKYDQVFVPEYNIGAMENPGLVTFKEDYLFRGGATVMQRTSRAEVVLHEMAHMWFGDLVTPKWWDDLWLKESFADLMGYQVSQLATRFDQAWLQFASGRKLWAYTYDQLPTTHPVIARIDDLEAAAQNFDGITYSKGAAVLRQLQELVGQEEFFAGARDYFAAHAYGSATFADLLTALAPHTPHDLYAWADAWLRTTTPSQLWVDVERSTSDAVTAITVHQSCTDRITGRDVVRPHELRVAGYRLHDAGLRQVFRQPVTLLGAEAPVAIAPATGVDFVKDLVVDLVVVNADDCTYGISRLDPRSLALAREHLSSIGNDLDRGALWTALWNLTRDALLPASDFVVTFCGQAPTEPNALLLRIVAGQVQTAISRYSPSGERDDLWRSVSDVAREALLSAEPGTDLQRTWADIVAELTAHSDVLASTATDLAHGRGVAGADDLVTDALRWKLTAALVRCGVWTDADVDRVLADDDTLIGHIHAITARSADPTQAAATWSRLVQDDLTNDEQRALLAGWSLIGPGTTFAAQYLGLLDHVWEGRTQSMAQRLVVGLFPEVDDDADGHEALAAVRAWYDSHTEAPAALRRVVIEQIDLAQRALNAQQLSG